VKRQCGVMLGGDGYGLMTSRWWWGVFAIARPGSGIWAKNSKTSICGTVLGMPCEIVVQSNAGRWWVQVNNIEGVGGRIWAKKNPKLSICGSILGVPCEMAVWSNTGRWWVQVNDMEVVRGLCIHQCEARGWDLGQNPETKHVWLGFGRAV
jgi:hypothetical protein